MIDDDLDQLLPHLGAILIDGPKGVGKTATASERSRTIRRLEREPERAALAADPEQVTKDPTPVLVDEWHRLPEVWNVVRRAVDDDSTGGRFLLTGSPPGTAMHSGAGRIVNLRMRPLTLSERGVERPSVSLRTLLDGDRQQVEGVTDVTVSDYTDEIIRGGLPGLRHLSGRVLDLALDGYLDRLVEHDLPEAGFTVRRPATLRAWMRAYAAATATTTAWDRIRDAATAGVAHKPAKTTTGPYTDLLTMLRILDPLDAWIPGSNHFARLAMKPKHHLVDPCLAVRLLDRTRDHLLRGDDGPVTVPRDGALLGGLFESLAALSIRTYAQAADARPFHLRTSEGRHEVDFVVERRGGVLALETKLSPTVDDSDVRHLVWLRQRLGDDLLDAVVLTTGRQAYRRKDGVAVVPLALLGA